MNKLTKKVYTIFLIWVVSLPILFIGGMHIVKTNNMPHYYPYIPIGILCIIVTGVLMAIKCPHCGKSLYSVDALLWKWPLVPENCKKCGGSIAPRPDIKKKKQEEKK